MDPHIWTIEWNDGMSAGIPEIDEDHKRFILLIDDLNRAIVDRMELGEIKRRLRLLCDDVVQHFAHEEKLFAQWQYPDTQTHAGKHAQVLKALDAIREKSINYDLPPEWISVSMEVKDLLIDHLMTEDMKYAEYLRNSRQGSAAPSA